MPLYIKQNNQMVKVSDGIALTDLEDKTVALDMSNGDQVVNATTGKVMSSVTIEKPSTMVASNIKSGVDIGGVVGSLSADPNENLVKRINYNSDTPYDATFSVTATSDYAFAYDKNIRNLTFTSRVELGSYAFRSAFNLVKVTFTNGFEVTSNTPNHQFDYSGVQEIVGDIIILPTSCFYDCTSLKRFNSNVDGDIN